MSLKAVSRQSTSPAATLLRNSRLFSIPPPLPRPAVTVQGSGQPSNTATLPYPTHQALATTRTSLSRGDWGLKRNLPLKSTTNTSSPTLRVAYNDTIEHITEFESASDHVRTVEKWEEMSVPMLMGRLATRDTTALRPKSAFEQDLDITADNDAVPTSEAGVVFQALKARVKRNSQSKNRRATSFEPLSLAGKRAQGSRWKFDGPWLPTMNSEEFTRYLEREVAKRGAEFHDYLVEYVKYKLYNARKAMARAASRAEDVPTDEAEARKYFEELDASWSRFSQADLDKGIQKLRRDCSANPLESELVQNLVIPFLGLPPVKVVQPHTNYSISDERRVETSARTTHPSAGLGYLRTNSYINNHPLLGPQANHTPVPARVVQPRRVPGVANKAAKLGVAGIVIDEPTFISGSSYTGRLERLELEEQGGKHVNVDPLAGSVTQDGRINLDAYYADPFAVRIREGELEERAPVQFRSPVTPLGRTEQKNVLDILTQARLSDVAERKRRGQRKVGLGKEDEMKTEKPAQGKMGEFTIRKFSIE